MSWDDVLTNLLDLLVRNYPDPSSARDVAEKAGLSTRFITFSGNLDNVWMAVLREARKSETGLQGIARVAQRTTPTSTSRPSSGKSTKAPSKGPSSKSRTGRALPRSTRGLRRLSEGSRRSSPSAFWRSAWRGPARWPASSALAD
jgi:hypothetical protein